jgi:hypothetical protein
VKIRVDEFPSGFHRIADRYPTFSEPQLPRFDWRSFATMEKLIILVFNFFSGIMPGDLGGYLERSRTPETSDNR